MLLLSLMICHRSLEHRQDNQRPHRALEQSRDQELRIRFTKGILEPTQKKHMELHVLKVYMEQSELK